jgi:hypothetical protein
VSTTPRQLPEATGMNSTLKYALILGLIVVLAFVVTIISLNVGPNTADDAGGGSAIQGPPLYFTTNQIAYEPSSDVMVKRTFPGFYEQTGDREVPVSFWFRNPHPVPVKVAVLYRSCSACSSARLKSIPPAAVRAVDAWGAVGGGPIGPAAPEDLLPPLSDAMHAAAPWQYFELERPDHGLEVPAGSAEEPTWGILQFGIRVNVIGPKPLTVRVGLTAGDNAQEPMQFDMLVVGVHPFEVVPQALQFGELAEGVGPQTKELVYWSATRSPSTDPPLPKPTTSAGSDPFLKVGEPVEMNGAELDQLATQLASSAQGGAVRVLGAYRLPVTVYRRRPDTAPPGAPAEPDVGPFERTIAVNAPRTAHSVSVQVNATVTGLVQLLSGQVADLRDFKGVVGVTKTFPLVTDRSDMQLEPLPEESRPKYLQAVVKPDPESQDRRQWRLTITVPPGECLSSLPADSVVVLRAKTGSEVRKVRIPVKGTSTSGR